MEAQLYRYKQTSQHTLGIFVIDGQAFYTIERPWLNNRKNESCIPTGEYTVNFMARSGSGKYRNVYHLQNVKNRGGILIHNGNLVSHSRGCIILGTRPGVLGNHTAVLNSKSGMKKLNRITGTKPFILRIS